MARRDSSREQSAPRSVFPGFADTDGLLDHLVELRHQQGLSQTTVAARMRTSQSAVARLEAGDSDARLSTLARYASALGTELGFVVHSPAPPEGPDHTRRRAP